MWPDVLELEISQLHRNRFVALLRVRGVCTTFHLQHQTKRHSQHRGTRLLDSTLLRVLEMSVR